MTETWKPVPSRPGLLASSWGRLKLPETVTVLSNGRLQVRKTKPTYGSVNRSRKTAQHAYMNVYNRKLGHIKVHRAVCEAFHGPAPFEKAVVIHLDENATNNRPENLRWGSQKENLNMPGFIAYCKARTGANSPWGKARAAISRATKGE